MVRLRARPTVYEINTAVLLRRLGRELGRPLGLGDVPGREWDVLAALAVDAVWLMGVWQRSPAGRAAAVAEPGLLGGYRAALRDMREDDVLGSPYCVGGYVVDGRFGDSAGIGIGGYATITGSRLIGNSVSVKAPGGTASAMFAGLSVANGATATTITHSEISRNRLAASTTSGSVTLQGAGVGHLDGAPLVLRDTTVGRNVATGNDHQTDGPPHQHRSQPTRPMRRMLTPSPRPTKLIRTCTHARCQRRCSAPPGLAPRRCRTSSVASLAAAA